MARVISRRQARSLIAIAHALRLSFTVAQMDTPELRVPKKRVGRKEARILAAEMDVEISIRSSVATAPPVVTPTTSPRKTSSPSKKRNITVANLEDVSFTEIQKISMAASEPTPPEPCRPQAQRGEGWGHHAVSLLDYRRIHTHENLESFRIYRTLSTVHARTC